MKNISSPARQDVADLIAAQRPGWSLDQRFYMDPAIYALESELWFPRQWTVIAHVSEISKKGDHVVRNLFGSEIVVVNAGDQGFRAYHNVCTHRGSRICKGDGRSKLLVCPYHAWSFGLTGELRTTRDLGEGLDPTRLGLHPVSLREAEGLIFCALDAENLPDLSPALATLAPAMRQHGFDRARIAVRRSYATAANWKLVLENFFECYHCRPAHPEYFRMNGHVAVTAGREGSATEAWNREVEVWSARIGDQGWYRTVREPGAVDRVKYSLYRQPIGLGRMTQSKDGSPVAPLMGGFVDYDGGETAMHFGRFSFAGCCNDHIIVFQFIPRGSEDTDVVATWLVDAEANLDAIDIDALTFMWDVTTRQDKELIEENASGIRSRAYRPGPYTMLEQQSADFVTSYLTAMTELLG